MKKLDYFIIAIAFFLAIGSYTIYFASQDLANVNLILEVRYENKLIYEVQYEEGLDEELTINQEGHIMKWSLKDGEEHTVVLESDKHIHNKVHLKYGEVKMTEANCKDKYCLQMQIKGRYSAPIICINGVSVILVGGELEIIV